jgi:hypothetical protein
MLGWPCGGFGSVTRQYIMVEFVTEEAAYFMAAGKQRGRNLYPTVPYENTY